MALRRPVKPLELVVSAIHCLNKKKSWSVQKIIKYLGGKYGFDTEKLRPFVCEGIRLGLATGIITHQSGLFRLNHTLIETLSYWISKNQGKIKRLKAQVRRRRLRKDKKVSNHNCQSHRNPNKTEVNKNYKKDIQKPIKKAQEESKRHKKMEGKI